MRRARTRNERRNSEYENNKRQIIAGDAHNAGRNCAHAGPAAVRIGHENHRRRWHGKTGKDGSDGFSSTGDPCEFPVHRAIATRWKNSNETDIFGIAETPVNSDWKQGGRRLNPQKINENISVRERFNHGSHIDKFSTEIHANRAVFFVSTEKQYLCLFDS